MTGEPLVEAKQLFAKAEAVSVAEGEAGIVHDHADVADVVVQTLELEEHHAEPRRARRNLGAGQRFDRLTVGDGVGDRFVAGDAFGERRGPLEGQGFEELLRPLVDEAQTGFQIDDRLALDGEPKMAGLDDPGVHGTHGDLEQTVAVDASEGKRLPGVGEVPPGRHVAAKGKVAVRPELVDGQAPQVRVAHGDQSEQIVDLALEATGGKGAERE